MKELQVIIVTMIIFGTVYKLFELWVGRKERLLMIEKLAERMAPGSYLPDIKFGPSSPFSSFWGLRTGCLLLGCGLGLLVGYLIALNTCPETFDTDRVAYRSGEAVSILYACGLMIGGGLGLLGAYLIEMKQKNSSKEIVNRMD